MGLLQACQQLKLDGDSWNLTLRHKEYSCFVPPLNQWVRRMAEEAAKFKVSIKGPGLTFDQSVDKTDANKIMSFVMTGSALPASGSGGGAALPNSDGSGLQAASGQTIKQFVTSKRPDTQYERLACLAYYMTHVGNTPTFKTADITKANTAAALPKLSNPSQVVGDTTSAYKYLSSAGKGAKQISGLGEAVVEALPDREAVKAAIAANRPGKKRKRSVKKKK
jgi:hypothetical protein